MDKELEEAIGKRAVDAFKLKMASAIFYDITLLIDSCGEYSLKYDDTLYTVYGMAETMHRLISCTSEREASTRLGRLIENEQ